MGPTCMSRSRSTRPARPIRTCRRGWGDIDWDDIFSELAFLPGTVLMMEIGQRYRSEQPASLERAKKLIAINAGRLAAAAE